MCWVGIRRSKLNVEPHSTGRKSLEIQAQPTIHQSHKYVLHRSTLRYSTRSPGRYLPAMNPGSRKSMLVSSARTFYLAAPIMSHQIEVLKPVILAYPKCDTLSSSFCIVL